MRAVLILTAGIAALFGFTLFESQLAVWGLTLFHVNSGLWGPWFLIGCAQSLLCTGVAMGISGNRELL